MITRIVTLLIAGATVASAALDLTPEVTEYTNEGFLHRSVKVNADNGSFTFVAPQGWTVRGGSNLLQLTPPKSGSIEAVVQAGPPAVASEFNEQTVAALEQAALGAAPPSSQSIKVVDKQQNPVPFNGRQSYKIVISYQVLGQEFHRSLLFINLPDAQLLFKLTAPKAEFNNYNAAFYRSVASWNWTPQAQQVPGSAASAGSVAKN